MKPEQLTKANQIVDNLKALNDTIKNIKAIAKNHPYDSALDGFTVRMHSQDDINNEDKCNILFNEQAVIFCNNVIAIYENRVTELFSEFDAL